VRVEERWRLVEATVVKRELLRLDCKKSIKFFALPPSERSHCVDHKKQSRHREYESRELRWREEGGEAVRESSTRSRGP